MIHFISIERNGLGNIVTNLQDVSEPFVTSQRASGKSQSWRRMARIEFFSVSEKSTNRMETNLCICYIYILYLYTYYMFTFC